MLTRHAFVFVVASGVLLYGCGSSDNRVDTACRSNSECEPTEICATNFCGGIGLCAPRETECDDAVVNYVCGCDGFTYQSACFANKAGVRLASADGPCDCTDNSECSTGQFCALEDSCLNPGECLPRPETCDPTDTQEVCGCDGVTYDNECEAFQAGSRVSAIGVCECPAAMCSPDEYCNGIVCDGPGVCDPKDGPCTPDGPVVGCNGVVYENACEAALQGVRVRPED